MPKKKVVDKYPAMSREDIEEDARRQEQAQVKYSMDAAEVDKALTEYMEMLDPIVWTNPKTNKKVAIAWVRRPTMKELKKIIPEEIQKYVVKQEDIPEEVGEKYATFLYEKMAELIVIPKRNAEQWEEFSNPWFLRRFYKHIGNIADLMKGQVEGF